MSELGDSFGAGEEVDFSDLPVLDRDGGDREGCPWRKVTIPAGRCTATSAQGFPATYSAISVADRPKPRPATRTHHSPG